MTQAPPLPPGLLQNDGRYPQVPAVRHIDHFDLVAGENAASGYINAIGYGESGVGKTALFTALPWNTDRWGSKDNYRPDAKYAVYVPWDAGSETLRSVAPEDRKHLLVARPKPQTNADGQLEMNPRRVAMDLATKDWRRIAPDVKTIIWDGGTRLAEQILRAIANSGATVSRQKKESGTEDRLVLGTKGEPGYMVQPIIPDYGMAQNFMLQFSEALLQQPMNVLLLCVSDYYKPDGGSLDGDTIGGPAIIGVKIIPKFMKDWDNVFRMGFEVETKVVQEPGKPAGVVTITKRVLSTEKRGIWGAKIRRPPSKVNPLARVELTGPDGEPKCREFWEKFDAEGGF
jgi:hypothetical protein